MIAAQDKGLIFDIQGHSVHDGPGTRTLVFMSGCPLRCRWCSNPEGMLTRQRIMYKVQQCSQCPCRCVSACRQQAISINEGGSPPVCFDRKLCDHCMTFECREVCYKNALQLSGKWYSVEDLMRILNRDRNFWGGAGGVTFSGGEPLLQKTFIGGMLKKCRDAYIEVAVETSANIPTEDLLEVLPYVKFLFVDVKHMDPEKHREGTGVSNDLILRNIRAVAGNQWDGRLVLRSPIVPGFNDSVDNAEATAAFMHEIGMKEINLLPFHRMGASKYEQLGAIYPYQDCQSLNPEDLFSLGKVYESRGLVCYLGSNTPF
jgi:pyruvate formate lyase activating enzyme